MPLPITNDTFFNPPDVPDSLQEYVGQPLYIFFCCFSTLMAFLGVSGNVFILVASCKYNAINIDKITLVLIRHLAVADLMYSVVGTLSMAVTNLCGGWCMGETVCHFVAIVKWFPATVEMFLILCITSYRVWSIKMALRLHIVKTGHAHVLSAVIWTLACSSIIFPILVDAPAEPVTTSSTCSSNYKGLTLGQYVLPVFVTLVVLIPLGLTILCNIWLLVFSLIMSRTQPSASVKRSLVTVTSLSFLFMISVLPLAVALLTKTFHQRLTDPLVLELTQAYFYTINTSCNAVLYTVTNRRFRKFAVNLFRRCVCENVVVEHITQSMGEQNNVTVKAAH